MGYGPIMRSPGNALPTVPFVRDGTPHVDVPYDLDPGEVPA